MRPNRFYQLESSIQRTPVAGITVVMGEKLVLTLGRIRLGGTFQGPEAQPLSLWVRQRDPERRHLPRVMLQVTGKDGFGTRCPGSPLSGCYLSSLLYFSRVSFLSFSSSKVDTHTMPSKYPLSTAFLYPNIFSPCPITSKIL